jgi:YidC/Oxa1 family membrane protein insertase
MNQRLLLALLLTGVVVILTPTFFGGGRKAAPPTVQADSVPGVAPVADAPVPGAAPVVAATVGAAAAAGAPSQVEAPSVRVDTTTVETAKARMRLSNLGGSLIGAEFLRYHTLGQDSSLVELARPGEPLLRFRIYAAGDTLALDRTVLQREISADGQSVTFRGTVREVPVEVSWNFEPDAYRVKGRGLDEPVGYAARVRVRAPGLGAGSYLMVELPPGMRSSEADSLTDFQHLAYAYKRVAGGADLMRFGKVKPGNLELINGPMSWVVAKSKYFLVGVLVPADATPIAELQVRGGPVTGRLATNGQATAIVPLRDGVVDLETYIGPQEWRRLVAMGREFETANPYGGFLQGMIQPFATIVMRLLLWMKDVLQLNYGWTLILFGILVRVALWPLNQVAMRSSLRMQRVQPELAAAQKKYAGSPEKQRDEIMRIYKEHGMSPFSALSGCLPMMIPMPILFALFFVFQNTIEFRGVSFWWMADISQHDPLFIIPIVMAGSMFVLSWIGVRNAPPNPQAKMLMYFLPAIMLLFLFKFAAGLNLYYAAQNLAAIPQQWLIANERAKITPRQS